MNKEFHFRRQSLWFFDDKSPEFQTKIIGSYSIDKDQNYLPDRSQLKFFSTSTAESKSHKIDWDLNHGSPAIDYQPMKDISKICEWLMKHKDEDEKFIFPDFVCSQNLCSFLMALPYEMEKSGMDSKLYTDWQFYAFKYEGTIYIREVPTEEKVNYEKNKNEQHKKKTDWGYRFKNFALDCYLDREQKDDEKYHENERFSCVYSTRLGKHSLIYAAPLDCFQLNEKFVEPLNLNPDDIDLNEDGQFITFKTRGKNIQTPSNKKIFAGYKTLQWWCRQSILGNAPNNDDMPSGQESSSKNSNSVPYVLGVPPPQPKIICGLRNASSGLFSSLKEYSMEKLLSKNKETWKPNVCMNFLNHLLSFIKTSIVEENKVYRFYYNADPTKICVDDSHSKDINFVVPDWYLNYCKANSK